MFLVDGDGIKSSNCSFLYFALDRAFDGRLQEANMIVMGNERCNQDFRGRVVMKESEMCARAESIGSGTCEVSKDVGNLQNDFSYLKIKGNMN